MDSKLVWSDEDGGDTRKKNKNAESAGEIDPSKLSLHLRRLTTGKGRPVIEISNLPANKKWCKQLSKQLNKKLACGGAYKKDFIEVHGEQLEGVIEYLDQNNIPWKKTGG